MELKDYVRIVLAHWVGFALLASVGLAGAAAYNLTQPKVYQAGASGLVTVGQTNNSSAATVGDSLAKSRVTSYVALATSTEVADAVLADPSLRGLGLPTTPGGLIADVTVSQPTDTVLMNVTARGPSPQAAAALANAWVTALAAKVKAIDGSAKAGQHGLHMETLSSAQAGYLVLPRTKVDLVLGLLLGLMLGLAYALVRHQLDRRLRNADEVERAFGVPVVGLVPQSPYLRVGDTTQLALAVTSTDIAHAGGTAEAFRKLRTNLAFMDVDRPPRVIVVTSPNQGDGKSTVAANLAAAIAISGQPVTLIDGDLRRPAVASGLGLVDGAGLTDVLVGRVTADQVMQDHPDVPGLRVLASGAIPPNPSELLGSQAMRQLVSDLADEAMVIIDAPPLLPVTDAAVLSRSADGAIVVISYGGTLDTELAASLNHVAQVHGRPLGIVLNRMRRRAADGYYAADYTPYDAGGRRTPEAAEATHT